jgi:hypothetical protein
MPSHAEATPQATCRATTKAGKPCRKQAVADGLCTFHSGKLDLAELGRRGGRARGVGKKEERAGDALEGLAHKAIEKLLTGSGSATAQAAAARLVLDKIAASSPYSTELAKRAVYAEIQAERAAELPAARDRLARLVEREARAMADEMTEERVEELVARRAEERAKELHEEQKAAELAAVRAEMEAPATATPSAGQVDIEQAIRDEERRQAARELEPPGS